MRTVKIEEWSQELRERQWQMRLAGWRKARLPDRRPRDPAERDALMRFIGESARRKIARAYEFLGPRHVRVHLDKL